MSRHRVRMGASLVTLSVLWASVPRCPGAASGAVLLESTFDKPPDARWTPISGRWFYRDQAYCETTDGGARLWSVVGKAEWTDYTITAAMKALDSGGSLLVAGRWQDPDNHYELEYRGRGDSVLINRVLFGQRTTLAKKADVVDIGGGKNPFATFAFALAGPVLQVAINGKPVIQTVDRTFRSGRVALGELQRRGVWDFVRVTSVPAPSDEAVRQVAPEVRLVTPCTALVRGKRQTVRLGFRNTGKQPMRDLRVSVRLLGVLGFVKVIPAIAPGTEAVIDCPIDTRVIRSAAYRLKVEALQGGIPVLQRFYPITIIPTPNPERMEVINWTGLDEGIETHGFTAFWMGGTVDAAHARPDLPIPLRATDPLGVRRAFELYNKGVAKGLLSGLHLGPVWARELEAKDGIQFKTVLLDGKLSGQNNPHHPAFIRWAEAYMEAVMRTLDGFGALRTANLNSEWDRPFDYSPETVALYRKAFAGKEPPRFTYPVNRKDIPERHRPVKGVIDDDNPYYRYLLWWWHTGHGRSDINVRLARIIKKHRPDILTIGEPVLRCPAVYGKARGLDVAQHWSYAFPGPRNILVSTDGLVATKKFTGQMISHDIQFLWKRNWVGPKDMTPSPAVIRECLWMNISRPMDLSFIWGTFLAIQDSSDPKDTVNPDVYETFKRFSETVTQPYGPMVRKTTSPHKPVAFLMSTASQLFVKGWRWGPGVHAMHFYDLLQAAQVPTDVIYEADVNAGALEKRAYEAVILPYCQTLPRRVHDRLVAFAKKGGFVLADNHLEADIPGAVKLDLDFMFYRLCNYPSVAKGKPDADQVKVKLDAIIRQLRTTLAGKYKPQVRIASPDVLYNRTEGKGMPLWTFINDRRTYGEWAGRFKTIHDAGVPQTTRVAVRVRPATRVLYHLLDRRELTATLKQGWAEFDLDLPPGGGAFVVEYPERIARLAVVPKAGRRKTDAVRVTVTVLGESGNPVPGLQPLHVEVLDGAGNPTEYSSYYCAEGGRSTFTFQPAVNEPGGPWMISVTDLTAGTRATTHVTVPTDKRRFTEIKAKVGKDFSLDHWDRD